MSTPISRREFVSHSAVAAAALPAAKTPAPGLDPKKIPSYNPNMVYRRLGKTGMMVSAVCLGGHWKRLGTMLGPNFKGAGYAQEDYKNVNDAAFLKNRAEVVSRCIEVGINYVDACAPPEIIAYAKVLQGRRDKMYFGFSWHTREPRFPEYRTAAKLLEGLDASLKEAKLDYVDLWRVTLPMEGMPDLGMLRTVEEATVGALEKAKSQGKIRHGGVSSHNRIWLKSLIEEYPKQIEVVLFPYTAATSELPTDSIFEAIRKYDVGVFGIKPFADNSLFVGDSSLGHTHAPEDSRRARLALRYILSNPAITAPIPGLINVQQVNNVVQAVNEWKQSRGRLSSREKAELRAATQGLWSRLRPGYEWLREWETV